MYGTPVPDAIGTRSPASLPHLSCTLPHIHTSQPIADPVPVRPHTRLIINGDDFGLTPGINRAIAGLHQAGALSSATLMANGPAFADAVAIARANPRLGIGCHIVLTDGVPISAPSGIPTLLGPDRTSFRTSLVHFVQALLQGRIAEADIRREALAQVRTLQAAGIHVTHLDTHKHTHLFPPVTRSLLHVAAETSVRAIRNPFEPTWVRGLGHGSRTRRLQVRLLGSLNRRFRLQPPLRDGRVLTTLGILGVSATGHLDASNLSNILASLPPGTWELVCHPGYVDQDLHRVTTRLRSHREVELNALLRVVPPLLAHPGAPRLLHFGHLDPSPDL